MALPAPPRYTRCPKCGHRPLPQQQALPAACPGCGVILAKVGRALPRRPPQAIAGEGSALADLLLRMPERVEPQRWWLGVGLLLLFALWGLHLIALDPREGGIGASFLHGPLLLFHEAGHVIFRLFGEWIGVLGGTLAQLLLPALICIAFLWKNRDPFGAAIGLWLLGVSLLDVAPYVYDALQPQLTLLNGAVGEAGGHDWIYLLESLRLRPRAQALGLLVHRVGALVVLAALGWAAWLLVLQRRRIDGDTMD